MTRGLNRVSVSEFIEKIGTYQIPLLDNDPTLEEEKYYLVDLDGLSANDCYNLGQEDFNKKRPPNFHSSDLNNNKCRSPEFLEAYINGYINAFKEYEALQQSSSPTI